MDVPDPKLEAGEVLIRVKACALNHLDIWERQGLPGVKLPMPHISGSDIAGVVEAKGGDVSGIQTGENVIISPGISCAACHYCREEKDSLCSAFHIMGLQVNGGYAEFVKAPARAVIQISEKLSLEEWAAIPLVFLTVWHMLITQADLQPGESILIHAAGSGIGSAAVQVAKWKGAKVFVTASNDEKLDRARTLGADVGINYKQTDFSEEIKKMTGGHGVNVVFEHIGLETFTGSLSSLAKGGRLVTCGATSGPEVNLDLRFLFMKQLSITGSYMGSRGELLQVLKLVEEGKLQPVIDKLFPMKEAKQAQERMLNREQFGKIVLVP
uniref:Alcohol dehydrogenase zinc-binding domain protein n=1 Tax=uncultured bacterium W4-21b TaxID=1130993 RepID=H9BWM5_9BACT|nr:alcohol dehydrogenase zinc-binding domain protein [uncultured bacterium W4-21b]